MQDYKTVCMLYLNPKKCTNYKLARQITLPKYKS